MHVYTYTIEGAAQTNLSDVLPFWIKEEYRRRKFNTLISKSNLK